MPIMVMMMTHALDHPWHCRLNMGSEQFVYLCTVYWTVDKVQGKLRQRERGSCCLRDHYLCPLLIIICGEREKGKGKGTRKEYFFRRRLLLLLLLLLLLSSRNQKNNNERGRESERVFIDTTEDSLLLPIGEDVPCLLIIIIIIPHNHFLPTSHSQPFLLSSEHCQCRQVSPLFISCSVEVWEK